MITFAVVLLVLVTGLVVGWKAAVAYHMPVDGRSELDDFQEGD